MDVSGDDFLWYRFDEENCEEDPTDSEEYWIVN
jgi:hypothetical protein